MPLLDPRTLYAVDAATFAGLAVFLTLVWRQTRGMPGLGRFALAPALFMLGAGLASLEGSLPAFFPIVVANSLFVLAAATVGEGTRLFYGLGPERRVTAGAGSVAALVSAYCLYLDPSPRARIAVVTGLQAPLLLRAAWIAWRRGRSEAGGSALLVSLSLGTLGGVVGLRAILVAGDLRIQGDWPAAVSLLCALLAAIGTTLGLMSAVNQRSLTSMHQAQGLLADREERYRSVVDGSPDLIYRADPLGYFTYTNPSASRVMGYSQGELAGKRFLELIRPDFREQAAEFYARQAMEQIATTYFEFPAIAKDGREVWIGQNVQLLSEAGEIRGFEAVARDINERKRAEQMRDDLTHSMVHDLRNPLTSVGGALEILIESVPARQRELPRMALRSARRLEALVEAILDVGRLESGRMPVRREPVAPSGLVQEAIEAQRLLARGRHLDLAAEVEPDLPAVSADPDLLGRVLQNLVGNSVKFIPEGGRIGVAARLSPGDPAFVQVSVSDDGPGLPREMEGRLFQKFASGSQKEHGSGLGLAFCRLAVEAQGGRIWAESRPGRGATFTFTLPIAPRGAASPAAVVARQPETAAPAALAPKPLRVLVADDDAVNRKLAVIALERLGHSAEEVADGEEALEALRLRRYDAVLMDMDMPRMDGLEAARRIAEWPSDRRPRIIAVTASARREDRERCLAAGMDDYVSKPFRLETIESKLGRTAQAAPLQAEALAGEVSPSPFDPERWGELKRLDETLSPGLLFELIETFLRQAPLRLEAIRAAVETRDYAGLTRAAHALKGSCGTIGAMELADLCGRLEALADPEEAPAVLVRLTQGLEQARAALAGVQAVPGAATATRPAPRPTDP